MKGENGSSRRKSSHSPVRNKSETPQQSKTIINSAVKQAGERGRQIHGAPANVRLNSKLRVQRKDEERISKKLEDELNAAYVAEVKDSPDRATSSNAVSNNAPPFHEAVNHPVSE